MTDSCITRSGGGGAPHPEGIIVSDVRTTMLWCISHWNSVSAGGTMQRIVYKYAGCLKAVPHMEIAYTLLECSHEYIHILIVTVLWFFLSHDWWVFIDFKTLVVCLWTMLREVSTFVKRMKATFRGAVHETTWNFHKWTFQNLYKPEIFKFEFSFWVIFLSGRNNM